MTANDLHNLMPLILLTGGAILVMLLVAIWRNHMLTFLGTLLSLSVSFASIYILGLENWEIVPLFTIDSFGLFYMALVFLASITISLLSYSYIQQQDENKEEYYILLLLATLGAAALVISSHFVSLFLGLETLSVSLYAMISYLRKRQRALEAGIKYLILAAFASAFLLFGMALVYAETGSMDFEGFSQFVTQSGELTPVLLTGLGLMIVGVGFKLGVVPFHLWTPDVYEGAPAPVTAFIATVSKGGMFALWTRFFIEINGWANQSMINVFVIVAVASMFIGNFLALQQKNIKRILAYSSISHLGYLLVAFLAGDRIGTEAVAFYFVAYFITTLGAFGVVAFLSTRDRDAEEMIDYTGLFWRRPFLATVFTAILLSLAGIPLTAGFVGKFYIVAAGADASMWLLLILLVINSVIGLFYYLRVITAMYERTEVMDRQPLPAFHMISSVTLAGLTLLLVWFGVNPSQMMEVIRALEIL